MRLLFTLLRAYPAQSALLIVALLAGGLFEGISLTALLPVLNLAVGGSATGEAPGEFELAVVETLTAIGVEPALGPMLLVLVAGILAKSALLYFAHTRVGFVAADITTSLRLSLLRAISRSRWSYFVNKPIGELSNAMATEAWRASDAFLFGVNAMALAIQAAVYGCVALLVSWQATVFSIVASGVVLLASDGLVRMSRRAGRHQTALYTELLALLADTLQSVKPFKAMARDELAEGALGDLTQRLRNALRRDVIGKAGLEAAQEIMFAVVICFGIYAALELFEMAFTTVMVLVLLLVRLLANVGKVQKHFQKMATCESAYFAVKARIDEAEAAREELGGGKKPRFESAIRLVDVDFAHGERQILDGLNLEITAGELTTLVGPSGTGKTTLLDLIAGLVSPQAGRLTIDDDDLETLDMRAWRAGIGYVPQETLLLHDSIAANVTLGDPSLTPADVAAALEAAGAAEFVAELPAGAESVVGERGSRLSGGQRQRILLARALAHRPRLLILDEATSALDAANEAAICESLERLKGQLTILAVAHRGRITEISDRVYRLAPGGVVLEQPAAATAD